MRRKFYFIVMLQIVLSIAVVHDLSFAKDPINATQSSALTSVISESATVEVNKSRIDELEQKIEDMKHENVVVERSLMTKIINTGILIVIGIIFFILLKFSLKKFEDFISEKGVIRESDQTLRIKTIVRLFNWIGSLAIICAILYMALENIGFNVAPLLAGAGIVGLAFGFGGQYLIRDLINGIFILLEGHYGVNDIVKIGEYAGVVESINLRITVLRDAEGRVIIVPNGEIKTVVNLTKDFSRAVLSIGIAYKENVDRVMDVIREIGKEIRQDAYFGKLIIDDLEMQGVDDFAESQVTIKFRIKTLPSKQFEVARELRRRIKNRFDELGIEIPFPHRTLYWGAGQDNEWFRSAASNIVKKAPLEK
ncbi:MAG: mechanosensitive ion channel family protein [Candidatus Omnitrophica bacterium]|nr:mechanosensitive ion channel family protein [Candidatus Omnitrophota bacterium]